ncbi:hypothetical protein GCM10027610_104810 [Dactylosporangium cerinum]
MIALNADRLGLQGWDLWDANKLSAFLDAFPGVAGRFAEFVTPGQVLVRAIGTLDDVHAALADGRFTVGQGQPACRRAFETAYRAAGGAAVLGVPSSEVYDDGPGWVQHFTAPSNAPADGPVVGEAVICAGLDRRAVAVTAELWDAIRAAGGGRQLSAVGYPVVASGTPPLLSTDGWSNFLRCWPAGGGRGAVVLALGSVRGARLGAVDRRLWPLPHGHLVALRPTVCWWLSIVARRLRCTCSSPTYYENRSAPAATRKALRCRRKTASAGCTGSAGCQCGGRSRYWSTRA